MRALPTLAVLTPFLFAAAATANVPDAPITVSKATMSDTPAAAARVVWVIATSKTYHCPADLWFGRTHEGQYMSEDDARAQGFRPINGKACNAPI
jgi:hypothetical protein